MGKKIKRSALNRIIKEETQRYFLEKRVEQKLVQEGFFQNVKGFFSPKDAMRELIRATEDPNNFHQSTYMIDKGTGTLVVRPSAAINFKGYTPTNNLKGMLMNATRAHTKALKKADVGELWNAIPNKYKKDIDSYWEFRQANKEIFADVDEEDDPDTVDSGLALDIKQANPPPAVMLMVKGYEAWRQGNLERMEKEREAEIARKEKVKADQEKYRNKKAAEDRRQRDYEDKLAKQKKEWEFQARNDPRYGPAN